MAKSPDTRGDRTPSPSVATLPQSESASAKSKPGASAEPLKGSAAKASEAGTAAQAVNDMEQRSDERRRRIAEAAYYRAERRGFAPGKEEDDWYEAEKEVDRGTPTGKKPEANDFPSPK